MWRFAPVIEYYGADRSEDWVEPEEEAEAQPQGSQLDPVEVAGSAKLSVFETMAETLQVPFISGALRILQGDISGILQPEEPGTLFPVCTTNKAYRSSLLQLQEWGLIERCNRGDFNVACGYFEVAKEVAGVRKARTILNARCVSPYFVTPPPVNVADIRRVIRTVSRMVARGKMVAWTMDLRHWFHQLELPAALRRYFGVLLRDGKELWRWICLPMGWAHSPRICQCLAWALVLACAEDRALGLEAALDMARKSRDPPNT
jgi:hypothetical protein